MDFETIDVLFRSRQTLLRILAAKGYNTTPYEKFGPFEIETMSASKHEVALRMEVQRTEGTPSICRVEYALPRVKNRLATFLSKLLDPEDESAPQIDPATAICVLPLSIVTSIAFAFVGVCWCLAITRTPLTIMAMIGVMILVGVVVNIGIVLVAHIGQLRSEGMERLAAIRQAGRDRLRPILMTTLCTLLGLLPLAVGDATVGGVGGPAYYPMARAIMGGLAFAAAVSLFFVPAFYVWFDDFNQWRRRVLRAR